MKLNLQEANEVSTEDLYAAADMWDHLVKGDFYEIQTWQGEKNQKTPESLQDEKREPL